MTVEELVTHWGFEVDSKPLEAVEGKIEGVHRALEHLAEFAIEAFSAFTIFEFAHATAEAGHQAEIAAMQAGLSTEAFQQLSYAARVMGMDSETVTMGFTRMARSLEAAKTGIGPASALFRKLGIDVKNVSSEQAFNQLADHFQKIGKGRQATAQAMQIFGRGGAQLIPILLKGSAGLREFAEEADEAGLVLNERTIEASADFEHTLNRLKLAFTGIRNAVGADLLEPLTELGKSMLNWVKANRAFIVQNISGIFKVIAGQLKLIWTVAQSVAYAFIHLVEALGGFVLWFKIIAAGFAIFTTGSLLVSIGMVAAAIAAMAPTLLPFILASFQAALPWIALAAAIILAGLAIDDFIAFFQGRDSLVGLYVERVKANFAAVAGLVGDYVDDMYDRLSRWALRVSNTIANFFQPVVDVLKTIGDYTSKFTSQGLINSVKSGFGLFGGSDGADGANGSTASAQVGFTPGSAPSFLAGGGGGTQQQNFITNPMTFNVGDNANPIEIHRAAKSGIEEGLGTVLRQTAESVKGVGR